MKRKKYKKKLEGKRLGSEKWCRVSARWQREWDMSDGRLTHRPDWLSPADNCWDESNSSTGWIRAS